MDECKDTDDTRTCEIVRVFLDQVVDRVIEEFNRIEQLRILAQRVLGDIGTRAPITGPGSGDVYNFREGLHNQHGFGNTQHEHNSEGQTSTNAEEQIAFQNREVSLCESRSETTQPKCFTGNTVEPIDSKKQVSCKSLSTHSTNQSSNVPANSQTSSHDDTESVDTIYDDTSSVTEEMKYSKYEMVQTVKTSLGDIKIYCNGEIDQAEIDRITMESKKILYTRKLESAGNSKTKGFVSRVGKFFRRMCCCCRSEQDEE